MLVAFYSKLAHLYMKHLDPSYDRGWPEQEEPVFVVLVREEDGVLAPGLCIALGRYRLVAT